MARSSVAVLALMLPALPPAVAAVPGGDAPPPNMLVVVLDDIGMDQSSFQPYGWNGAPESPSMPVLAEIASKGVSFRNFWATPECSPSRAAMLTGRHSVRTGVVTAVVDPMLPAVQLLPSEITLPKLLRHDRGALNRSTRYERLSRPKGPRGVSDEAFDEQEAAPSRGGGRQAQAG
jgi:hypothetical protein